MLYLLNPALVAREKKAGLRWGKPQVCAQVASLLWVILVKLLDSSFKGDAESLWLLQAAAAVAQSLGVPLALVTNWLVIDKASSKPKGTAFVEFKAPEGARKAADACARGRCVYVRARVCVCVHSITCSCGVS
eukprot:1157364-Pelagomonas_calceolata.AAC.11